MTEEEATIIAQDAGNAVMRRKGLSYWDEECTARAAEVYIRLLKTILIERGSGWPE
jgi:hypothetical protein